MNVIKEIIKQPQKIIYGLEKIGLMDWLKDEQYLKLVYRLAFQRKLNLDNPKAYTEKLNWYKLNYYDSLMSQCVDKYEVRKYVKKVMNGDKYLNECFGIWDDIDDIDIESLPDKFVLKLTNGSGDVVICRNKADFDFKKAKKILDKKIIKRHFSSRTREWVYYNIPSRIICERLLESKNKGGINDYKIFCFYGEPKFLYVTSDRNLQSLKMDFFDLNWTRIPVTNEYGHSENIVKPDCFDEMLDVARKLSAPFPHVRVDLYLENKRIYFGELTFYHFGGFTKFKPDRYDFEFGKYFDINKIKDNF